MAQETARKSTYVPVNTTVLKNMREDETRPLKGIQKAMVKTMTQANLIPHFSYCDEYDLTSLVGMKHHLKQLGKDRGVKISFLPIIVKACSLALNQYPVLNAHVDEKCENVIYRVIDDLFQRSIIQKLLQIF